MSLVSRGGTARAKPRICVPESMLEDLLAQDLSAVELARIISVEGAEDWPAGRVLAGELLHARIKAVRAYRSLLQETVFEASPLVRTLVPHELRDALHRLRPPLFEPDHRLHGLAWRYAWRSSRIVLGPSLKRCGLQARRDFTGRSFGRLFRRDGAIAGIAKGEVDRLIGIRVVGSRLEVGMRVGEVLIMTLKGRVRVFLPHAIPETLASAATGREMEEVVAGEMFDGHGYRICEARIEGDRTVIDAVTGLLPFVMPWLDDFSRATE